MAHLSHTSLGPDCVPGAPVRGVGMVSFFASHAHLCAGGVVPGMVQCTHCQGHLQRRGKLPPAGSGSSPCRTRSRRPWRRLGTARLRASPATCATSHSTGSHRGGCCSTMSSTFPPMEVALMVGVRRPFLALFVGVSHRGLAMDEGFLRRSAQSCVGNACRFVLVWEYLRLSSALRRPTWCWFVG